MAKTIIILEDEAGTSRISVQVLKFDRPSEPASISPAGQLGDTLEALLVMHLHDRTAQAMPMQSTARH
jgi:hypothetical protein